MNDSIASDEQVVHNIAFERVRAGLIASFVGLLILTFGAKPEWFGLNRSPVVGFIQITVILIGLAMICLGGTVGLSALWGSQEKSIVADIGLRLISTGYVISVFSGMADVFGMSVQQNAKVPFFGPWQSAGMQLGMIIIAVGVLMIVPYRHFTKSK